MPTLVKQVKVSETLKYRLVKNPGKWSAKSWSVDGDAFVLEKCDSHDAMGADHWVAIAPRELDNYDILRLALGKDAT